VSGIAVVRKPGKPLARVRRWATIQLVAVVIGVAASVAALRFQMPILAYVVLIRTALLTGLILALGKVFERLDIPHARQITMLGVVGVVADLTSALAGLIVPAWLPYAPLTGVLPAGWLFGIGWLAQRHPSLPKPLPTQAMLGGAGWAIVSLPIGFDTPIGLLIRVVGGVLYLATLVFFFRLTRLGLRSKRHAVGAPT
jgi:hypothetical protein